MTSNLNPLLERLRDILHREPSESVWDELCALLDRWPLEHKTVALDYALPHLEMWPDALRPPPHRWRLAYLEGTPPLGWELARTYDVVLIDPGTHRIACIKALRTLTGSDLREAKRICTQAPSVVHRRVGFHASQRAFMALTSAGAQVGLYPDGTRERDPDPDLKPEAHLNGRDLSGMRMAQMDLTGVQMADANLAMAQLEGAQMEGANLRRANLRGLRARGLTLKGADLRGSHLEGADLREANLHGADLREASLMLADLRGADLTKAQLDLNTAGTDHTIAHSPYRLARYDRHTRWPDGFDPTSIEALGPETDLTRASLHKHNLAHLDLSGASLIQARLNGANLRGANLRGANLTNADLRGADLRSTRLGETRLTGALYNAQTRWDKDIAHTQLGAVGPMAQAAGVDLQDRNLQRVSMHGADLRNACIHRANLEHADLSDALLEGAQFQNARYNNATRWPDHFDPTTSGALGPRAQLPGVSLPHAVLHGIQLSDANLRHANLTEANLYDANFEGADLRGAQLTRAHLPGANLCDADLTEATLTDADFEQALFNEDTRWPQGFDPCTRGLLGPGAQLPQHDLTGIELSECDLSGANLQGALLDHANLSYADLTGADLRGASLRNANLSSIYLHQSDLRGADLSEADLRHARLHGAHYDEHTQWPEGFDDERSHAVYIPA
ncbi:MAG: ribosomal protein L7/L12 [Myxococcota bacterium]